MNKHYSLFVIAVLSIFAPLFTQAQFKCGHDQVNRQLEADHPELLVNRAELEAYTKQFIANYNPNQRSGPYVIPLVFHIMHRGGNENITDEQVRNQVDILNIDYNKRNADTTLVISEFKDIIANVGIEFRLATIDPDGNPTNGIEHIYSSQTYQGQYYSKLNPWPREKYVNIWVVKQIGSGAAGYSQYPTNVQLQPEVPGGDGVMILQDYVGAIGTAVPFRSRAITHEIGHYLNLKHVWGDNNDPGNACGDDDVNDTPESKGYTNCPSNKLSARICDPQVIENYQNYMEYSYCSYMFTEGQKARMIAALESPISGRSTLWSPSNLAATGTAQLVAPTAPPIVDFSPNKFFVCADDEVIFTDHSYNDSIIGRNWTFKDADIETSTSNKPKVKFYASGWQDVTLEAIGVNGTRSATKALVYVGNPDVQYPTPYYNNFDDANEVAQEWPSFNIDRDAPKFQHTTIAGHSGKTSIMLNNFDSRADYNIDELITPAFECSDLDNNTAKVSFYYSYATRNNHFNQPFPDSMIVYASKDCGRTWGRIYTEGTNNLINAGYVPNRFVPGNDQAYWKKVTIPLSQTYRTSFVRFRIQVFGAHDSNNFYIDDWNLGMSTVGIDEEELTSSLSVMPNPFNSNVQLQGLEDGKYDISLFDITGRQVYNINQAVPANGAINLDLSDLTAKGVYIVKVNNGTATGKLKLVRE